MSFSGPHTVKFYDQRFLEILIFLKFHNFFQISYVSNWAIWRKSKLQKPKCPHLMNIQILFFYSQMLFNLYKVVFEDLSFGHIKLKDSVRTDEFKWWSFFTTSCLYIKCLTKGSLLVIPHTRKKLRYALNSLGSWKSLPVRYFSNWI